MYINLPGSYVQLQDGNLRTFARDNTQSVLVVGTASKGLTSEPFVALDLLSVVNEFGATSEVAKTVAEVRKGGATNIYVYRLPGVAPELTHIGSDVQAAGVTADGISIRTLQESPEAAPKYGVAYRHAKNIATSGTGAADDKEVSAELIVVNLNTSEVVWQGSALEGSVLDTGEVDVQFELGDIDLGTGSGVENEKLSFSLSITPATKAYSSLATTVVSSATGASATATVTVNVPAAAGAYSTSNIASVAIATPGTGYAVGDTIKVSGALLGGAVTTNDLTLTVATITGGGATGPIATFTTSYSGNLAVHGVSGSCVIPVSGVTSTYEFSDVTELSGLATTIAAGIAADESLPFGATSASNVVTVSANGTTVGGELLYPATHPWFGYTARPYFSGTPTITVSTPSWGGTASATVAVVTPTSHGRASDIGLYPQDVTKPFAAAGGGIYVPLDKVVSGGSFKSYGLGGSLYTFGSLESYSNLNFDDPTFATFSAGSTGESISLMKRFEKLHTAFENLDLASFDFIVPVGVALNSKNTAEMVASTNVDFFTDDTYPTPKSAFDYLGYCAIVNNGDYTYTYLWSDDGENLKIASDGPIAAHASASVTYNEVNFAHLLAKYCYENSTDYRFVYGMIGTSLPDGVSPRAIRSYFGSAPDYQYDTETSTYYVPDSSYNGTGLLGNKFVGGKSDFNEGLKHGGFFLTSDGTLDYSSSNLLLDDNGYKIDIGKHIGVVAVFGRVTDDINSRRNPYFTNAAPIVAGMLPNTSPADSLINRRIPGLTIDYRLETKLVDVACGLGLVVAKNEGGIASIADSPTFASPTSDYTRLTTVRIVSKISEDLRLAARPYIGKGLSAPRRAALEAALGEVLKANIAGEPTQTITAGTFRIEQTAADKVLGKMKIKVSITPVFELRQIIFSVNLSAQ